MNWLNKLFEEQLKSHGLIEFAEKNKEVFKKISQTYSELETKNSEFEKLTKELNQKNKNLIGLIEELNYIAYHDTLTGLFNRVYFINELDKTIESSEKLFSIIYLDIDRFKFINEGLGHTIGDKLIEKVAIRLKQFQSDNIQIARLNGDVFVILLKNLNSKEEIDYFLDLIQKEFKPSFKVDYNEIFLTISIGVSTSNEKYRTPADMMRDSDTALFYAKKKGRARAEYFNSYMNSNAISLVEMEIDLRHAIEKNEFRLYYQPILEIKSNSIKGFEALIRWEHPNKGFISPAQFIPIAEETGIINYIGEWVIKEAIKTCKNLESYNKSFFVSVNLSFAQFREKNIPETVYSALKESNLNPNLLYLELTESIIMDNILHGLETLASLRELGVFLSIDDFGTGYSSLSYLKKFPVNNLKIDQSFVRDSEKNIQDKEIIKAIITLAHSLGLTVTAEGVENEEQLKLLNDAGCDRAQGFFISKAIPFEKLDKFISEYK